MASSDDPSRREGRYDRRELIRRAGAAGISIGVAGSGFGQAFYGPLRFKGRWLKGDLSLITWAHFVPAFDVWLDKTWAPTWGQQNDVQVKVDHINNTLLPARAQAEIADTTSSSTWPRVPSTRTMSSTTTRSSRKSSARSGRSAESRTRPRTTRRRRSTSPSPTTTSRIPSSGGTTSGTASARRRTRGTAFAGPLRS